MLRLYRRHLNDCPNREKGRSFTRCKACPIWIQGTIEGRKMRRSLDVTVWARAEEIKASYLNPTAKEERIISVEDAATAFLAYYEKRISADPMRKYRLFLKQLQDFAVSRRVYLMKDLDFEKLALFYGEWKEPKASTRQKKLERARAFYRFCYDAGWIPKNYAKLLKAEREDEDKVDPFTAEDQRVILSAEVTKRTRAFIQTLHYSALRISDVCMLRPEHLVDGCIRKVTIKTRKLVNVPIPPALISLLQSLPLPLNRGYFFLQGSSEFHPTQSDYWREVLGELFKEKVPGFHPHRFRHTAACNWLAGGLTMEEVAALLGSSVKIVEKHYESFAPVRRQVVSEKLNRLWNAKPKLVRVK